MSTAAGGTPYRFVHAADLHLDSPLRSLALRDPELATLIGNATRRAFVRIIDLCLDERVDALLLAGDLYDGEQRSMKTAGFLTEQLRRLSERGIRTFIIRGNHDTASPITAQLDLPAEVQVFGGRAEAVAVERAPGELPIVIHGLSHPNPRAPESLLGQYPAPVDGAFNIGLLHTSLEGAAGHEDYAPCTTAELRATGFQYWALGHVHQRTAVEGPCTLVMPGIPQGRDLSEPGAGSVSLVTVHPDGSLQVQERVVSLAQFERVAIDVTGLDDWEELAAQITEALAQARRGARSDHLVARVQLTGETPLAWRIRTHLERLTAQARERAQVIGACWIESLEAAATAPPALVPESSEPLLELKRLIEQDVLYSHGLRTDLATVCNELRAQLPQECRVLGADPALFQEQLALLAREGIEDVLAHLRADGPEEG